MTFLHKKLFGLMGNINIFFLKNTLKKMSIIKFRSLFGRKEQPVIVLLVVMKLATIYFPAGIWAPPNTGWKPFSSAVKLMVYVWPSCPTHEMTPVTERASFSVPAFLITPSSCRDVPSLVSNLNKNKNEMIVEMMGRIDV